MDSEANSAGAIKAKLGSGACKKSLKGDKDGGLFAYTTGEINRPLFRIEKPDRQECVSHRRENGTSCRSFRNRLEGQNENSGISRRSQ